MLNMDVTFCIQNKWRLDLLTLRKGYETWIAYNKRCAFHENKNCEDLSSPSAKTWGSWLKPMQQARANFPPSPE